MLSSWCLWGLRVAEVFTWTLRIVISPVENTSEESSIDGTLIQHNAIFLVITWIACNSDNWITTSCKFFELKILHRVSSNQRLLRIVQHVSQCVHSHLVVRGIHSHGLLTHSRLISVPGRLIVIWERNNTRTDTQNHARMNFTMSVLVFCLVYQHVAKVHCNHSRFFFFDI